MSLPRPRLSEEFHPVTTGESNHEDAGAFRERRNDLTGEAEDRGLVRRAVADDESATPVGQGVEDAGEGGTEPLRVLRHELGIGLA